MEKTLKQFIRYLRGKRSSFEIYHLDETNADKTVDWFLESIKANPNEAMVRDVLLAEKIKNRIIERIPKDGLNIDQIRMFNRIVGIVEGFINNGVLDSK